MSKDKKLTTNAGCPVAHNQNTMTAGPRGPQLLQDVWFLEKLAHFDREVIPERRMHAKGSGAYGTFSVTHDITKYTRAKIFSQIGKKTELFTRFTTVAGERGAADAERDIRGFSVKFYTEEGNWASSIGGQLLVFAHDDSPFFWNGFWGAGAVPLYCTPRGRTEEGHGFPLLSQTPSTHQWLVGLVYGTAYSTYSLPSLVFMGIRK